MEILTKIKPMHRVKSILISQPEPATQKSPYFDLKEKYGLKIDFIPFIHVEGVDYREFRKEKVLPTDYSAVIFTSKNAIENYFSICEKLRIEINPDMKYFCITETIALYLQKFVQYRKRKVFFGVQTTSQLLAVVLKRKEESFFFPCSNVTNNEIPDFLESKGIKYGKAIMYKTVSSDLSHLADVNYDIIAFFSPSGIKSLFENFPTFKQGNTKIAVFGPTTSKAVEDAGLALNIVAPTPQTPSMTMAIEEYIKSQK
ncbi:MAG: uroporphyrinogen-III synthase [Sphingobacteriales bacterium]|jgi:uroporphyrinogen-III synthase